jgi:hypothetical protein
MFIGAILGAGVAGAGFFAAGFVGPILFMPSANQGPLFGIFIAGPAGFVAGGVMGFVIGAIRPAKATAGVLGAVLGGLISLLLMGFGKGPPIWEAFFLLAGAVVFALTGVLASTASGSK